MVKEGKLFVIEGPDGSGKSTMVSHLVERMCNSGFYTEGIALPNPDSKLHQDIRDYLKNKNLDIDVLQGMMIQNMDDCFSKIIIPKLEQGINIILDRWAISTIIYNLAKNGNIIKKEYITKENEIDLERIVRKTSSFKWPDKIFYLNTSKQNVMLNSIGREGTSKEVFDKSEMVFIIYNAYQEFMKAVIDRKKKFRGYRLYEFITSTNKDRHVIVDPEYGTTINKNYLSMEDKIYFEMLKGVGVI